MDTFFIIDLMEKHPTTVIGRWMEKNHFSMTVNVPLGEIPGWYDSSVFRLGFTLESFKPDSYVPVRNLDTTIISFEAKPTSNIYGNGVFNIKKIQIDTHGRMRFQFFNTSDSSLWFTYQYHSIIAETINCSALVAKNTPSGILLMDLRNTFTSHFKKWYNSYG